MISDFWAHYQSPFFSGYGRLPQPQNLKIWDLKIGFSCSKEAAKIETVWLLMLGIWNFQCSQIQKKIIWQKLGVTKMGGFPETGPPNFWTFKPLEVDESKFQNR